MKEQTSPKSMVQRVWYSAFKKAKPKNWAFCPPKEEAQTTIKELIARNAGFAGVRVGAALFKSVEEAGQRFKGMEGFGEFRIKNPAGEILFPL